MRFMLQALVVVPLSAMEGNTRVVAALLLFAGLLGEFLGQGFQLGAEVVSAALYKLEVGGCLISVTTPPNNGQEGRHFEPREILACKMIGVDAQLGVEEAKPLGLLDRTALAVETLALTGDPEPWKRKTADPNAYMEQVLKASLEQLTPNKVAMCQTPKVTYLGMRSAFVKSAFNIIVYYMMKEELADRMAHYNALAEGQFKKDLTKLLDSRKGWRTLGPKTTRSKEMIAQDAIMVAAYYVHPLSFCGAQAPVMFKMLSENMTDDPANLESQSSEMILFAYELCAYLFEPTYGLVELMKDQDSQYSLGTPGIHDHRVTVAAAKSTWRKMLREFALVKQLIDQYTQRPAKIVHPDCLVAHEHPEAAVRATSLNDLCALLATHSAFGGRVRLCAAVGSSGTYSLLDDRQYYFPKLSLADFAPKFGLVTGPHETIEFEPLEAFFDKVSPLVASLPPWERQPPSAALPAATEAMAAELQTEQNLCQNPETPLAPAQVIDSPTPKKVVQTQEGNDRVDDPDASVVSDTVHSEPDNLKTPDAPSAHAQGVDPSGPAPVVHPPTASDTMHPEQDDPKTPTHFVVQDCATPEQASIPETNGANGGFISMLPRALGHFFLDYQRRVLPPYQLPPTAHALIRSANEHRIRTRRNVKAQRKSSTSKTKPFQNVRFNTTKRSRTMSAEVACFRALPHPRVGSNLPTLLATTRLLKWVLRKGPRLLTTRSPSPRILLGTKTMAMTRKTRKCPRKPRTMIPPPRTPNVATTLVTSAMTTIPLR